MSIAMKVVPPLCIRSTNARNSEMIAPEETSGQGTGINAHGG
jgi:hypothetical protein